MSVRKYRKKPVVIEALQWDGSQEAWDAIKKWVGPNSFYHEMGDAYKADLIIKTLEGDMRANPGDFIIRGVSGEFYPCKPDIFAQTYEEVQ